MYGRGTDTWYHAISQKFEILILDQYYMIFNQKQEKKRKVEREIVMGIEGWLAS